MVIEFSNLRLTQLEEEVELFHEMGIPSVQKIKGITNAVKVALSEVKAKVGESPFTGTEEEIVFFKTIKPRFTAIYLYHLEIFKIECDKPHTVDDTISIYYQNELQYISQFLDRHKFLYQYYLLGGTELDTSYFLRGKELQGVLFPYIEDSDSTFSTPGDQLFAKFEAYEKVRDYLMDILSPKLNDKTSSYMHHSPVFKWTGDKSNLIELTYALYDSIQINEGNITIAELITWFEQSFNVNLSRHYQIFSEIKSRKSVSRTRFLDHARDMLLQHMEEGDAFVPKIPKPVSGSKSMLKK